MIFSIILLPFISFICSSLFGFCIGSAGAVFLTVTCLVLVFIFSCLLFLKVGFNLNSFFLHLGNWIYSDDFYIPWGFLVDNLALSMFFVISFISTIVHLFSGEYMYEDPHLPRFMSYLSFFTFFMLILVSANNLIQLFVGWEGVGLCSYLLINFWFSRLQANKAAIKALVVNKVGDLSLLFGLLLIFLVIQSLEFSIIFPTIPFMIYTNIWVLGTPLNVLTLASALLLIGSVGKSAQIGLHTWLPDAMEGPTPVSALIHAATMVTAGVFLLIRNSFILEFAGPTLLFSISLFGAFTAFFAATVGLVQNDIKKIIAYSTCSQLGYMVLMCGASNYVLAFFHVVTHAFFKALLFLTAGALIHALHNEQDIRKMGGMINFYPFYYIVFFIGSLSLSGIPFLAGFYSKDLILENLFHYYHIKGSLGSFLGNLAAGFSAFYSIRLIFLVFFQKTKASKYNIKNIHKVSDLFLALLSILCFLSITLGYLFNNIFMGVGTAFFALSISNINALFFDNEFLPFIVKQLPLLFTVFGCVFPIALNNSFANLFAFYFKNFKLIKFLNVKGGFDYIYNVYLGNSVMLLSYKITFKLIDKVILEFLGPLGVSKSTFGITFKMAQLQTGVLSHYIKVLWAFLVINIIINYL